jgi:hypothetical protein
MTIYIFAGPTISWERIRKLPGFTPLPPVAQGDVYRTCQRSPEAIGIVDGYFSGVPAVWHKEILWALSRGIPVFGSSSMGALRAAELHQFGMQGVGQIFESFKSGDLEDDDEVAILHGPPELGFKPLSESMVNIRATLAKAVEQEIISQDTRLDLVQHAKQLFYKQRSWASLLEYCSISAQTEEQAVSLREWLQSNVVDQKQIDAEEMLLRIQNSMEEVDIINQVSFHFEWTHFWDGVTDYVVDNYQADPETETRIATGHVLDELRLDPGAFHMIRHQALLRLLADQKSRQLQPTAGSGDLARVRKNFRERNGLFARKTVDEWLQRNGLDESGLSQLLEEEWRLQYLLEKSKYELDYYCLQELKAQDRYSDLRERATDKQAKLEHMGMQNAQPEDLGRSPLELRAWFFEGRLNQSMPENLTEYLDQLSIPHTEAFYALLAREVIYLDMKTKQEDHLQQG